MSNGYGIGLDIISDLDIEGYHGKWTRAVEYAESVAETESFDWWMAARKRFLELGGCYLHERCGR